MHFESPVTDRYAEVNTVLYRVLLLNLVVALAKILLGYYTGAVSIVSDGFHSLTDSASNVVALIGISIARQPPDADLRARDVAQCHRAAVHELVADSKRAGVLILT